MPERDFLDEMIDKRTARSPEFPQLMDAARRRFRGHVVEQTLGAVLIITVIAIVILSYVTERQKDRLKAWTLAVCAAFKWPAARAA